MAKELCRWGILSTAEIAQKNWAAICYSTNATVQAVASRSQDRSEAFINLCQSSTPFPNRPVAYGSYEELLAAEDIDAVYIPLPTGIRKEWVIRAAEAGKHVLCEKPCAISHADLVEMTDACAKNNVQFMDGVMFMHSARYAQMRQTLDDPQQIGTIRRISSNFSFNGPEEFQQENIRTSGDLEPQGCLGDLGWYQIRFALWAMNYQMPRSVIGRMLSSFQRDSSVSPVPIEFTFDLFFENGVTANFYNAFITEHQQVCTIAGTNGFLRLDDFVLPFFGNRLRYEVFQSQFVVTKCDFTMEKHTTEHSVPEYANNKPASQESFMIERFSDLVLTGQQDPFWPEISLKTQKVLDKALESALAGSQELMIDG